MFQCALIHELVSVYTINNRLPSRNTTDYSQFHPARESRWRGLVGFVGTGGTSHITNPEGIVRRAQSYWDPSRHESQILSPVEWRSSVGCGKPFYETSRLQFSQLIVTSVPSVTSVPEQEETSLGIAFGWATVPEMHVYQSMDLINQTMNEWIHPSINQSDNQINQFILRNSTPVHMALSNV